MDFVCAASVDPTVHADNLRAAAWFKTSAAPGRVLYEDEHQVVVVPHENIDFTSMMWLRPRLP